MCVLVCAQSYPTLCSPMGCNPPGSSVHGIFQAMFLEWAFLFPTPGIFSTLGLNLCLLCLQHWQMGSLPRAPPGRQPVMKDDYYKCYCSDKKDLWSWHLIIWNVWFKILVYNFENSIHIWSDSNRWSTYSGKALTLTTEN